MAEINITKKRPVGPWIIAGLIVIILLAYLFYQSDRKREANIPVKTDTTSRSK